MRRANRLQDKWQNVLFAVIGSIIIIADQGSKAWIRASLAEGQSLFEAGFFRIVNVQNTGAAFGLFPDHSFFLTIVGLVSVVIILAYVFAIHHYAPWFENLPGRVALGLILGGTAGNLVDRVQLGYITDFIDFNFWPAFNVADSAVTVGAVILAFSLFRLAKVENR